MDEAAAIIDSTDYMTLTNHAYSVEHGRGEWTRADVSAPSPLRLHRAEVTERWLLSAGARDRVSF